MPKSKVRKKKPNCLKGVPANIIALAPSQWSSHNKAIFCKYYIATKNGISLALPTVFTQDYHPARSGKIAARYDKR